MPVAPDLTRGFALAERTRTHAFRLHVNSMSGCCDRHLQDAASLMPVGGRGQYGRVGFGLLQHGDNLPVGKPRCFHRVFLGPVCENFSLLATLLFRGDYLRARRLGVERLLDRLPPRGQVGHLEPPAAQQRAQRCLIQAGGLLDNEELLRAGPFSSHTSWHGHYATQFPHPPRERGLRHPDGVRQLSRTDGLRPDQSLHHPRLERGTGLRHDLLHLAPGVSSTTAALTAAVRQLS